MKRSWVLGLAALLGCLVAIALSAATGAATSWSATVTTGTTGTTGTTTTGTTTTTPPLRRPTLRTDATATVVLGGVITDNATIENLDRPVAGSTVTFRLYGPDNATCTGAPVYTSADRPVALSGSTGVANAEPFTPTIEGVYRWVAMFSGDIRNTPVTGACNDANEMSTVTPPTLAPPPVPPPPVVAPPPPPVVAPPPPGVAPPPVVVPPPPVPGIRPQPPFPPVSVPPTARIAGRTGCQTKTFRISVTGTQITKVVFSLDKKRRSTLTAPNRTSPSSYALLLTPAKLPRGKHTVTAVVTFRAATGAAPRTLRTTFLNSRVCRGVTPEGPAG